MKKQVKFIVKVSILLFFCMLTFVTVQAQEMEIDVNYNQLSNPEEELDNENALTCMMWNCVWFGTYPQTEVTGDDLTEEIINANFDGNGDAVINGVRYHKMEYGDVARHYNSESTNTHGYRWDATGDDEQNHYFVYEPIKWRVLEVKDGKCLLLSDRILDEQSYSSISDWLNGYETNEDSIKNCYRSFNFMEMAFSPEEQNAILDISDETGKKDKIFMLNKRDFTQERGFTDSFWNYSRSHFFQSHVTDYSAAKGVYLDDNQIGNKAYGTWWLGNETSSDSNNVGMADYVSFNGNRLQDPVNYRDNGIRPALNLDLSKEEVWQYAGTFTSASFDDPDTLEKINEIQCLLQGGNDKKSQNIMVPDDYIVKKYGEEDFKIDAKTDGGGKISYISSNSEILEVEDNGNISIKGVGDAKITIYASSNSTCKPAKRTVYVKVEKGEQNLYLAKDEYTVRIGDPYQKLEATTDKGGTIKYMCVSPIENYSYPVQINEENDILVYKSGTFLVKAYVEENDKYLSTEKEIVIHVLGKKEKIIPEQKEYTFYLDTDYEFQLIRFYKEGDGAVTVTSSDNNVIEAGEFSTFYNPKREDKSYSGLVRIKKEGKVVLTILSESNDTYEKAEEKITINIVSDKVADDDNGKEASKDIIDKQGEFVDENGKYVIISESAKCVIYTGDKVENVKSVHIPNTIKIDGKTYKVTSIADNAFKKNTKIEKVVIGSNVKSIGKNAFYGCSSLKTLSIGKNVTTIGDKAFYKCTKLTKITIPSKVSKIGKQAFYGCKKLKSITIKTKKLTSKKVESKAFSGIHSKATIKVPKSKLKTYKKLLKSKGAGSKVKIKK